MIGAGGGFLLVPILLLLYPKENTELITSTSLAVVFFTRYPSVNFRYPHVGYFL